MARTEPGDAWRHAVGAAMLAALLTAPSIRGAAAQSPEAFYSGKTLTFIVPADPGGSYDLHTRLIAKHIVKWVPGRPTAVVQTMQGAGGLRATNYIYERAPQDGTVIGMPVQENVIADVLGGSEVRYRVTDFNWIGRLAPGVDMIVTWATSGIKTIADAKLRGVPLGATGPASGSALYPLLLNNIIGTRFTLTTGYKHSEMLLAMERGETVGAFTSLTTLKSQHPSWIAQKKISALVATASERVAEFPDVPHLVELASSPADKQVMAIFASASTIGRSIMTTPKVPAERVAALRNAFDAMLKDPEFLADHAKTHAEFGPIPGAALQAMIAGTRDVPPSVLERARAAARR